MHDLTAEEVNALLASGDFDRLIGVEEGELLECKAAPYQLEHEHQKSEFAKDVSALANAKGGIILIGVRTERDATRPGFDEIKETRPFERTLVDPERYHNILKEWIYPAIQSIEIAWHPSKDNSTKGIVSIKIPTQSEARWPFLITRSVDERGKRRELYFGLAERRRANAEPVSVEEIHRMIKDGASYGSIGPKIEVIKEMIEGLQSVKISKHPTPDIELDARIGLVLSEVELGPTHPSYVLAIAPMLSLEIPSIFSSGNNEIARLLDSPPRPRSRGFDIGVGEPPRIVAGERLRALCRKAMSLNLWRDGSLIFAADGDDFLCWGRPMASAGSPLRINPLALIESTYAFCSLAQEVYKYASPKPKHTLVRLELKNLTTNNISAGLIPGPLNTSDHQFGRNIHRAPAAHKSILVSWPISEMSPGEVAFKLISRLYSWFEIAEDKIPYAEGAGGTRVISPEEIRRLNP